MKLSVIGATGFVGAAIVKEALERGHEVKAVARNTAKLEVDHAALSKANINVADTPALSEALKGSDTVISAFNPGWTNPAIYDDFIAGAKAIESAVMASGVKRFITIGGAGSLFVGDQQLVDGPDFPAAIKPGATAARDYLNIIKQNEQLDWVFFSPAPEMHQGITTGRTGKYRLGLENPVFDENGRSVLSVEDLAVAIIDEAEQANHHRQRFTAAY